MFIDSAEFHRSLGSEAEKHLDLALRFLEEGKTLVEILLKL
jgi:hypothetical protein